jgi:23S rRNA pseudouridine1911/1915/1917 synthase
MTIPPKQEETIEPEAIPLDVIYEDDDIAVIDKPAGLIVHPGVANEKGTLVHAMLARWPEIALMNVVEKRVGIVHRLDKDTSGLLVIARNDATRRKLSAQFQERSVKSISLCWNARRRHASDASKPRLPATRTSANEWPSCAADGQPSPNTR